MIIQDIFKINISFCIPTIWRNTHRRMPTFSTHSTNILSHNPHTGGINGRLPKVKCDFNVLGTLKKKTFQLGTHILLISNARFPLDLFPCGTRTFQMQHRCFFFDEHYRGLGDGVGCIYDVCSVKAIPALTGRDLEECRGLFKDHYNGFGVGNSSVEQFSTLYG